MARISEILRKTNRGNKEATKKHKSPKKVIKSRRRDRPTIFDQKLDDLNHFFLKAT